jgi:uncharacterized protein (TIGR02466 family)
MHQTTMNSEAALLSLAFAGRAVEAHQRLLQMLREQPERASTWTATGIAAAMAGRMDASISALRRANALDPSHVLANAYLGIVLEACGRGNEAGDLLDHEGLICRLPLFDQKAPEYLAKFNRDLLNHVLTHPTREWQPAQKATHGGWQTGELLNDDVGIIRELKRALFRKLHEVIGPPETERGWRLTAWAVALGRDGYQEPHIHQAGTISGVYYVQVPTDSENTGTLRFPRSLPWLPHGCQAGAPYVLRPCTGEVVIFPSNFWHETDPLASDSLRVSVAFDLLRGA